MMMMSIIKRIKSSPPPPKPSGQGVESYASSTPVEHQSPTPASNNELAGLEWNGTTERRSVPSSRREGDHHNLEAFKNAEAEYRQALEHAQKAGFTEGHDRGYAEGFQEGQANGYETGYTEGMEEAKAASQAIWDIIAQLDSAKNTVLSEAMEDLVPMAMAIAQRILKTEVRCDRTLVTSLALDTLEKVDRTQKEVVFKVHPSDVATLRQHIQDNEEIWLGEIKRTLIVAGDESVDPGSCIAETSGGQIDARFKTQLNVVRGLLGLREEKEQVVSSESEFDHLLSPE